MGEERRIRGIINLFMFGKQLEREKEGERDKGRKRMIVTSDVLFMQFRAHMEYISRLYHSLRLCSDPARC